MELTNRSDLQLAMKLANIKPSKGLGQHFLVDADSLHAIIEAGDVTADDTVLEIGPGLGVMTGPLTEQAKQVVAVEADPVLGELLRRQPPSNLQVAEQDIMTFDLSALPTGYKVVANIPYYLTSRIFRLLLEAPNPPSVMSLLIQKEVAERIVAKPGKLSVLALSVQYYAQAELVLVVERHKFWPAPKVDSAVLRVVRREQPAFAAEPDRLFRLIKAGFGEKRKMLKNALAGGLNLTTEATAELILQADLGPTVRAQELTLEQWERLYNEALARELI